MKLRRNIVITAVSLAFMGAGFTGVAVASGGDDSPSTSQTSTQDDDENEGQEGKEAKKSESPGDQKRQNAACRKAGIPLTATNIDYDDETKTCTLGEGDEGDDEGQEGNEGAKDSESPGDQAEQNAACRKAGVPLTATNIDYDDETKTCTLDEGDDGGGNEGDDDGGEDGGNE